MWVGGAVCLRYRGQLRHLSLQVLYDALLEVDLPMEGSHPLFLLLDFQYQQRNDARVIETLHKNAVFLSRHQNGEMFGNLVRQKPIFLSFTLSVIVGHGSKTVEGGQGWVGCQGLDVIFDAVIGGGVEGSGVDGAGKGGAGPTGQCVGTSNGAADVQRV